MSGLDVREEGTTLVEEVVRRLDRYNGGTTQVIIEIEYKRVGGATPAAARCIGVVFAMFGAMDIGVEAIRFIEGTHTWSQHAYGNAVDFMVSGERHRQLAYFLDANRGGLDIAHLLADPYFPSPLRNHYDHVHTDFYPAWGGTPPGHTI
ncbi:MAG: hypothetical protein ACRDIC_06115 [bacterium]